jgi:NitT/TauT family transport system permease protein
VTVVFLGGLVAAWQLLVPAFSVPQYVLPTPGQIVRAGASSHRALLDGLKATAAGAFTGFVVGNAVGFAAAVAVASSATASRVILPMALGIRSIPIIALTPFLTLLLGRGLVTVTAISALIVFFPTLVNGVLGLRSVPDPALELMRVMNASPWQVFWRLRLPTALPDFFSAFRVAAASSVLGALVAEWVASGNGLGQLILQSSVQFDVALMWSAVFTSTLLAVVAFGLVGWAEKRLVSWQPQE